MTAMVGGALLASACGADIGGGIGQSADAGSRFFIDSSPAAADASGVDATAPCVEGDDRIQDEATGTCYMYFQAVMTWDAAESACAALGAHLVYSNSLAENALFSAIAPATLGLQDIWVGGTDVPTEGTWHWIDGTTYYAGGAPIVFAHWRTTEPNNSGGNENCMIIEGDNNVAGEGCLWDDRACTLAYPHLCERP
jgi:hypothetical protein